MASPVILAVILLVFHLIPVYCHMSRPGTITLIRVELRLIFHVCYLDILISGIWQAICDKWKKM